jgi:di/tricarboxylate transporter
MDLHDDDDEDESACTEPQSIQRQLTDRKSAAADDFILKHIGTTIDSVLAADVQERMRVIYRIEDVIRGTNEYTQVDNKNRIIVTMDSDNLVALAVDTVDRSGLMLDISKCLARLQLKVHHTEAAVVGTRSLSIWRCECSQPPSHSADEIWSIIDALLANDFGVEAVNKRGLRLLRARVLSNGRLVGITASDIDFRRTYMAAIVAIQKEGRSITDSLSSVQLDAGDVLILQASDDSPLLQPPLEGFNENFDASKKKNGDLSTVTAGCLHIHRIIVDRNQEQVFPEPDLSERGDEEDSESPRFEDNAGNTPALRIGDVWNDLQLISTDAGRGQVPIREFLTAMTLAPSSKLKGRTVAQAGIDKLPDIFLVDIERPDTVDVEQPGALLGNGSELISYSAVPLSEPLHAGDVLWFSGTAKAVGDLRKIPGLKSYQSDEVEKMKEKVFDRRLVQAVVARKGPLVGKTVKEVRFRTQYGAAVIAVQREGQRVHEHPGQIKLQAGDVLLLEAGPSFMANKVQHDRSFALVAEVQDSAPPRLRMLIPAIVLMVGAYAAYMAKLSTLFGTAMVAAILMVALGVLSESEARAAIQWEIYLTIASAFGIGTALVNSGVAGAVANFLVKIGNGVGTGDAGFLGAVYISTVLISQLVANNAAAALIFPIAMGAAEQTSTDLVLMSFTIMLAASAAFMTAFGYQTNLMVMCYGGYNTKDYLVFGTPMQIVLWMATTIYLVTPAWICWIVTFAILVASCCYRVTTELKRSNQKFYLN